MKKTMFLLTAIAASAMLYSGCAKPEISDGNQAGNLVTVYFGTENTDPSTKATLTPDAGETTFQADWENEDAISVEYSNDNGEGVTGTTTAIWNGKSFESKMPEYTGMWIYDAAYPVPSESDNSVDFGSNRTQKGNAYNSKYDIMIGTATAENAAAGKDALGKDIVFQMTRQTAIAYFHFTSELDEVVTSATLKVTDGAIANSSASINEQFKFVAPQENDLTEINLTFEEGTAPSAKDFQLWFNVLPTTYNVMTLTVETASKSFTIKKDTKGELDMYEAGKLYKVKKSEIAWTDKPTKIYFYESFDKTTGKGGNDGQWSGSIASNNVIYDNEGWSVKKAGGANQCLKLGSGDEKGSATTPALGIDSQSASLYFKAGAWNSTNESKTINLSVSGSGTISPTSVNLAKGEWSEYVCTITGANATTKIVFEAVNNNDNRFFIDEVYVYSGPKPAGITLYTVSMAQAQVEGGTLSASLSEARAGAEVSLTATPEEGYKFNDVWTVTNAETSDPINVEDGKFTMPAANVTVSGSFSKIDYTISKTTSERGSFVAKKGDTTVETAQFGDEITLVATPNVGFELTSWEVVDSKGTVIEVNDNKFTMPALDVTITATFSSTASYTVSFSVNGNVTTGGPYKESEKIVFPADPEISGVTFMGWITNAIVGTQAEAPAFVETSSAVMGTENITYYAVFASQGTEIVSEKVGQTLTYDTWTYSGSTTNKSSYRLFHKDSYIESAAFDLSTLTKVVVYGGTFGGDSYKNLTIGDGTNTWKAVTVSGSSQTGPNTYTNGTPLSGTGKLRITSNSGTASSTGVRISKVVIYVGVYGYTDYCTNVVTLTSVAISGTPAKTEYTVNEAFDPEGLTVTGTYSDGSKAAITEGISWNYTPATFTESGSKTVSVTATVKSIASAAYDVVVTVNADKLTAPANLKCTEKTESSLTFTWDAVDKASDYQVSTDGGTTYSSTQNATTYTWTGLTANTSYTLYVKAIGDGTNYTDSKATSAEGKTKAAGAAAETIDFESASTAYTFWTFTNMTSKQTGTITAHGGTYYGTTGGNATASIQTKTAIATPKSITFYVSKQSDNEKSSSWKIQVSSNNSTWTDVKTQSASSMSKGSWVEVTQDLSSYSNVYVRVYYTGSTAVRNIDDLTFTYSN